MFDRSDLVRAAYLLLVLFTLLVTLSQILVVHKHRQVTLDNEQIMRERRRKYALIMEIEGMIENMMNPHIIHPDAHQALQQTVIYTERIKRMLDRNSADVARRVYRLHKRASRLEQDNKLRSQFSSDSAFYNSSQDLSRVHSDENNNEVGFRENSTQTGTIPPSCNPQGCNGWLNYKFACPELPTGLSK